jgi:hypothetical protein
MYVKLPLYLAALYMKAGWSSGLRSILRKQWSRVQIRYLASITQATEKKKT